MAYKRVYSQTVIKWAKLIGIPSGSIIFLIFMYLAFTGSIDITYVSGDMICDGTIEDPCYAYASFIAKEDVYIYPLNYDPWGRNVGFDFSPEPKEVILQRSWGDSWRTINLSKTWSTKVNYAIKFSKGTEYHLRVIGYKNNPSDTIKWGFGSYELKMKDQYADPLWMGKDNDFRVKGDIVINQPVKWFKKIGIINEREINQDYPREARNIKVYRYYDEIVQEKYCIDEIDEMIEECKNFRYIDVTYERKEERNFIDNNDNIDIRNIENKIKKIEIEYETEGPYSSEIDYKDRKVVTVNSNIDYTNIIAYTRFNGIYGCSEVEVEWINEDKSMDYDCNVESDGTYIGWIVPHLSDQTFEIYIGDPYSIQNITGGVYVNNNSLVDYRTYISLSIQDTLYCNNLSSDFETLSYNWYNHSTALDINSSSLSNIYFAINDSMSCQINGINSTDRYILDTTIGDFSNGTFNNINWTYTSGVLTLSNTSAGYNLKGNFTSGIFDLGEYPNMSKISWGHITPRETYYYQDSLIFGWDGSNLVNYVNTSMVGSAEGGVLVGDSGSIFPDNNATYFDGVDDGIDTGSDIIGTGADSVSFWFYPNGYGSRIIISNLKFQIRQASSFNRLFMTSDGLSTIKYSAINSINLNEWQHIVATRTATGIANFYINGVLSGTADGASGTPEAGTDNVLIGGTTFQGKIDEVHIWDRALSSEEIKRMYNISKVKYPISLQTRMGHTYDLEDDELLFAWHGDSLTGTKIGNIDIGNVEGYLLKGTFFDGIDDGMDTGSDFIEDELTIAGWIYLNGSKDNKNILDNGKTIFKVKKDVDYFLNFSVNSEETNPQAVAYNGTNYFVVGVDNDRVYSYDSSGTYTGFNFLVTNEETLPYALYWNGSDFFVAGTATDKVYKYNSAGTYSGVSFSISNPEGITSDGNYYYVVDNTNDRVYEYDLGWTATGESFDINAQSEINTDITTDNDYLYVIDIDCVIYQYNMSGTYMSNSFDLSDESDLCEGLHFNGSDFLVADTQSNNDRVSKYNFNTLLGFSSDGLTTTKFSHNNLSLNTWQYVAVTRNSTGISNIYIDGILSGIENQTSGTPASGTTNVIIGNNNVRSASFKGIIDELHVWDKTFTPDEIKELYESYFNWGEWVGEGIIDNIFINDSYILNSTGSQINDTYNGTARYIQYRAFFETINVNSTPILADVILKQIDFKMKIGEGNVAPVITFESQTPSDLNSFNAFSNGVNITYEIVDDSLNYSNVQLWQKINSTLRDNPDIFENGTGYNSDYVTGYTSDFNDGIDNFTFLLHDNNIYPGTYNFNEEKLENEPHSVYDLDQNAEYLKIRLYNVSNIKNYSFFEIYADNQTASSNSLRIYYCNETYTTGNPQDTSLCTNFYNLEAITMFNHTHTMYSKHHVIPFSFNMTSKEIGGVYVTNTSYFLVRGRQGTNAWNISYITNVTRLDSIQYSTNNGNAWSNLAGTVDAHLHQFTSSNVLFYFVEACDNSSLCTNSTIKSDNIDLINLPPTAPDVYNPKETIYTGIIRINYTNAISPQSTTIDYYNISLLNPDFTFNLTINTDNNYLNSSWDSSIYGDSEFIIKVEACDTDGRCSNGFSANFTTDHTHPLIEYGNGTLENNDEYISDSIYVNVSFTEKNFDRIIYILYNETIPSNLLAYWNFDRESNNQIDYSENEYNGTVNGATFNYTGDYRGTYSFDGADDEIDTFISSNTHFTSGFTISAWIYPRTIGEGSYGRIVDKSSSTGSTSGFVYGMYYIENRVYVNINGGGVVISAEDSVPFYQWTHVLVTVNASRVITHYINGILSGTPDTSGTLSQITTKNNLTIGNYARATSRTFDGLIDELMIWNRTLTADEAVKVYNRNIINYTTFTTPTYEKTWEDIIENYYNYFVEIFDVAGNYNYTSFRNIHIIEPPADFVWYIWNGTAWHEFTNYWLIPTCKVREDNCTEMAVQNIDTGNYKIVRENETRPIFNFVNNGTSNLTNLYLKLNSTADNIVVRFSDIWNTSTEINITTDYTQVNFNNSLILPNQSMYGWLYFDYYRSLNYTWDWPTFYAKYDYG